MSPQKWLLAVLVALAAVVSLYLVTKSDTPKKTRSSSSTSITRITTAAPANPN